MESKSRMAKETNIFEVVRKLRYMQTVMEGTFLSQDKKKYMVQHTHQNIIDLHDEKKKKDEEDEEEEEESEPGSDYQQDEIDRVLED